MEMVFFFKILNYLQLLVFFYYYNIYDNIWNTLEL